MKKIILLVALSVTSIEAMAIRDVNTGSVENQCNADNGSGCVMKQTKNRRNRNQFINNPGGDINTGKVDNQCIADDGSGCQINDD